MSPRASEVGKGQVRDILRTPGERRPSFGRPEGGQGSPGVRIFSARPLRARRPSRNDAPRTTTHHAPRTTTHHAQRRTTHDHAPRTTSRTKHQATHHSAHSAARAARSSSRHISTSARRPCAASEMEAGFEPAYTVLQTAALPLGHSIGTTRWRRDSNPRERLCRPLPNLSATPPGLCSLSLCCSPSPMPPATVAPGRAIRRPRAPDRPDPPGLRRRPPPSGDASSNRSRTSGSPSRTRPDVRGSHRTGADPTEAGSANSTNSVNPTNFANSTNSTNSASSTHHSTLRPAHPSAARSCADAHCAAVGDAGDSGNRRRRLSASTARSVVSRNSGRLYRSRAYPHRWG